jgi:hypothetical protein
VEPQNEAKNATECADILKIVYSGGVSGNNHT